MRRRILLADDSVTIQKVIELTFMDEDYEVRAVSNGDDAINAMPEVEPHFVIADVHMPGANGYEVCRRSKERRPDVPVLLLVGTFEPFDEAQSRAVGADSFLKKPFDSQELLQRVGELLSRGAAPAPMPEMPEMPEMAAMPEVSPFSEPAQEWGGFQVEPEVEAEAEPFSTGSEFSLEEPSTDTWRAGSYTPESDQLFELEEEPAGSAVAPTPPDSVFGFEPQPIAAEAQQARSAGFELPLSDESHEPQADARMAPSPSPPSPPSPSPIPPAVAAGTAAVAGIAGDGGLSDADVERIARRVVELLGDKAVRDVAWEVVPDLAEVVIKDRLRELESQAENLE